MMGTDLQQLLRSLCSNTEWNYAVFWKIKHRSRMVLTWEDAYCCSHAKHDYSESECGEYPESLHDGCFSRDPLGVAVAKMSYHVYSLGEGIVGQVAATGKHQWIFADRDAVNTLSSSEHCDGWQAQFLAGIQTIVVAAVVPHGVVQLGSLSKVKENTKLMAHLKDLFSVIKDTSASHVSNSMGQGVPTVLHMTSKTQLLSQPGTSLSQDFFHRCVIDQARAIYGESPSEPLQKEGYGLHDAMLPGHIGEMVRLERNSRLVSSVSEGVENAKMVHSAYQKLESNKLVDVDIVRKVGSSSSSCNIAEAQSSYDAVPCATKSGVEYNQSSSSRSLDQISKREVEKNMELQSEYNGLDTLASTFKLPAGYELHEVLGPGFLRQDYPRWLEVENTELVTVSEIPDRTENSMLKSVAGSDHLLEAVVADFCHKKSTVKNGTSFSTSAGSLLTNERMAEDSTNTSHTGGSTSYSIDCSSILEEGMQHCFTSSESYIMRSSKGFSSGPSLYKEQLLSPTEPAKGNKKKVKPGENCRPRPRDRQLIQDRIKELRELVPNGSKCSIDTLLERTIKHMLYLQCITTHADKLNKCAKSRVNKDAGALGCSDYQQGASWAVEVGSHMKICPIVVENLNMNGQMLIEMLCEDCDHFLEVAEAIRGLGLIILKGVAESHGDKTWMRFVVEGQNSRNMHRMDVLCSLVQILQTKTAI